MASKLSVVRDFGVGSGAGTMSGVISGCAVEESGARYCWVWLLVLKAGPSVFETDSILIVADVVGGSSTRWERLSCALFFAPDIHLNVIL